jgi:hypothetical protein
MLEIGTADMTIQSEMTTALEETFRPGALSVEN